MQFSRRRLIALGLATAAALGAQSSWKGERMHAAENPGTLSATEALTLLQEGNARFESGRAEHPRQSTERLASVAGGQQPFTVVLGCADSRVPPEIVFDRGLGDLFILRVAGNIPTDEILASMEYAVEHFATPLLLVLGHSRCGAVSATIDALASGDPAPGHIGSLVDAIAPAVTAARAKSGDLLRNAILANVANGVESVRASQPILAGAVDAGLLSVAGAYYDLDSGRVEFLSGL